MKIKSVSIRNTHNWDRYTVLRLAAAIAPVASIALAVVAAVAGHAGATPDGSWWD